MHFGCNKGLFTLKAQNLNMNLLFLLCQVKDKIDIERYEKIIKTNCYNYRALYFHESKN